MPTAVVVGAATPIGREVCAELSSQNIATIAVVHDDPASKDRWARLMNLNKVRIDVQPANTMAISALIGRMKPTHVVSVLACTAARASLLRALGLPPGNYEEGNFKITDMYIDAVVRSQLPAHIAYLSAVGASARASSPALASMAGAEQKLQLCTLPYTIVRSPPLLEAGSAAGVMVPRLLAQAQRGLYGVLAKAGLRDLALARRPVEPRLVARALVDAAFCEGAPSSVLQPHQLGL